MIARQFKTRLLAHSLVLSILAMTGCAAQRPVGSLPPLLHHGPPVEVEPVDVLDVTPEMRAFVERFVKSYGDRDLRVQLLATTLTDNTVFGFSYQDDRTLTAAEAFETRSGNCIGFANLAVALAREAGLQAWYQEVALEPRWTSAEDTLLVAKHVNVVIAGHGQSLVLDTSGLIIRDTDLRHRLDDQEALALYYNNLGAEALIASDLSRAFAWQRLAVQAAPGLPDPWINLGVVYSRNRQLDEAVEVYQRALEADPRAYAALANLYEIYLARGDEAAAAQLEKRVERYRRRNPYNLLALSDEALEAGQYDEAVDLLNEAIEIKGNEHRFHFALARALFLAGHPEQGEASLQRARELAPEDLKVEYNRPLSELAQED